MRFLIAPFIFLCCNTVGKKVKFYMTDMGLVATFPVVLFVYLGEQEECIASSNVYLFAIPQLQLRKSEIL